MAMTTLTQLVGKDYPVQLYSALGSYDTVSTELTNASSEKTAIMGVISSCNTNTRNDIQTASTALSGYQTLYDDFGVYDSNWGMYYDSTKPNDDVVTNGRSLNHWIIDVVTPVDVSGLKTSGPSAFECDGIKTDYFPSGSTMFWLDEDENDWARVVIVESKVLSGATSGSEDDTTYVSISAEAGGYSVPAGITHICDITTSYYYNSSYITTNYPNIASWSSKFIFAINHLTLPYGSYGTYGINAKIGSLSQAQIITYYNETKLKGVDGAYREFTTWNDHIILDNTDHTKPDVAFYDDGSDETHETSVSFSCSGDLTSVFTSGTDLLIDCGSVSREKPGIVDTSTYTDAWYSNYTEVVMVIDPLGYIYSPSLSALPLSAIDFLFEDGFETLSISGGSSIPSALYIDPVTFAVPGNQTSTFVNGINIVGEYNTGNLRYFKVHSSSVKTNPLADRTLIRLKESLPITTGIWRVSKYE